MQRPDIAIIGGGLVGASLALALQAGAKARGWRILLVEPFAPGDTYQPSYDARSSALSYGSRLIYQRLGVWDALAEHAEAIREIQVSDQGRFGVTQLLARDEAFVLNVGSAAGGIGLPGQAVYGASKFGLHGFSQALRRELDYLIGQCRHGKVAECRIIEALAPANS